MGLEEIPKEVRRRIERLETEVRILAELLKKMAETIVQIKEKL